METTENQTPEVQEKASSGLQKAGNAYRTFQHYFGIVVMVLYRLRKVVMAAPVVYYALKLAAYNGTHLPEKVGLFLQNSGAFSMMLDRYLAVTGPLVLTCGCLFLMLFSRKAMYAWAISIFTLALPVLLLVSNVYPA